MVSTPSPSIVKSRGPGREQKLAVAPRNPDVQAHVAEAVLAPAMVLQRLDAKVLLVAPALTEWHCIKADHAAMAEAGHWDDLLESLRFADQSRAVAAGGKRVSVLVSRGARAALAECIAARDWLAAETELARFEAVLADSPDHYAAGHLVAQAHLDLAWAKRGITQAGQMSRALWQDSGAHIARAEAVLAQFDPIEQMSPLLAGTQYQLVRGIGDGKSLCRDWFEDWCDLDPSDSDVHATHAQHMLPNWFGTLENFDHEAAHAAALTAGETGQAAYAVFYMAASEVLGSFPPGMDLARFLTGLKDFQAVTGCQYRANLVAGVMVDLMHGFAAQGAERSYDRVLTRAALSDLLWNRLTEFHLSAWEGGKDGLAFALTEIFGPALLHGARIGVGGTGLTVRLTAD
jgi:hypothetical protein